MGITNTGNQTIYDAFGQALTGDMQGKSKQSLLRPGVLEGMGVAKFSNTQVRIDVGVFNISDGTRAVKVQVASQVLITTTSTKPYIVARYSYVAQAANFVDFLNVTTKEANDIELANVIYNGASIDTVSTSTKDNGRAVTADNTLINTGTEYRSLQSLYDTGSLLPGQQAAVYLGYVNNLFIDPDTAADEVVIGTILTGLAFPADADKYFYFILRTGVAVDITFKLRTTGDVASAGGVRYKLSYYHISNGANLSTIKTTMDSAVSTSQTITMPATAYTMLETTTTVLKIPDTANVVPDRLILCRLTRDQSHVDDTYTGNAIMLGIIPI